MLTKKELQTIYDYVDDIGGHKPVHLLNRIKEELNKVDNTGSPKSRCDSCNHANTPACRLLSGVSGIILECVKYSETARQITSALL